jgi:hypothetical protein
MHQGLQKGLLKAGDNVTVHIHPLRNGAAGGELMTVQKADGATYDFSSMPPKAN